MTARPLALLAAPALCLALAGCFGSSSRDSRAGGTKPASATVLDLDLALADVGSTPLAAYAGEVARRSGGTLKLAVRGGIHHGDPDAEVRLIEEVRSGRVPLAAVGARAFDVAGMRSFQALVAPALITTHKLQDEVVNGPIGTQMLASLHADGLTGLAVYPGPLRRMLGVTRDFRSVADFRGARVGIQRSRVAEATLRALGARPVPKPSEANLRGLDGYEQQLRSVVGNSYYRTLHSITPDLVLWPRPLVLIANSAALAQLTDDQRRALTDAVAVGREATADPTSHEDGRALATICLTGVKLARFSRGPLDAALRPVYAEIERDPATKRYVEQIRALRGQLPAEPEPKCTPSQITVAAKAGALDGVYHMYTSLKKQTETDGGHPTPENWGDWVLMIHRGRFLWTQQNPQACTWAYGSTQLDGDKMIWDFEDGGGIAPTNSLNRPGEHFVWKTRLYHGTLGITGVDPPDISGYETFHWRKVADEPSRRFLYRRCLPPAAAHVL
jgi:TRAP-type C4-dicarboxylate transport system substrate-binding protein